MTATADTTPDTVTADVKLGGPGWQLQAKMTVPTGPVRLRHMLPLVHALADAVVDSAAQSAREQGEEVSCKKGCGACCRQLVPIAEAEARRIHALVEELPEPRRSEVRARFAAARQRLAEAGLLAKLLHPEEWSEGDGRSLGMAYFQQGIPCPFLEEESCSIHPDRPVACREYLVTSPAEHCARPTAQTVRCVPLPLKVWTAVARFDEVPYSAHFIRWVPLILAPEWSAAHPDEPAPRPGPELLRELFGYLTGKGPPTAAAVPPAFGPAPAAPAAPA
jgi:Fe-S-cluster containining protein